MGDDNLFPDLVGDREAAAKLIIQAVIGQVNIQGAMLDKVYKHLPEIIQAFFGKIQNREADLALAPNGVILQFLSGECIIKSEGYWICAGYPEKLTDKSLSLLGKRYGISEWRVIGTVS